MKNKQLKIFGKQTKQRSTHSSTVALLRHRTRYTYQWNHLEQCPDNCAHNWLKFLLTHQIFSFVYRKLMHLIIFLLTYISRNSKRKRVRKRVPFLLFFYHFLKNFSHFLQNSLKIISRVKIIIRIFSIQLTLVNGAPQGTDQPLCSVFKSTFL